MPAYTYPASPTRARLLACQLRTARAALLAAAVRACRLALPLGGAVPNAMRVQAYRGWHAAHYSAWYPVLRTSQTPTQLAHKLARL